MLVFVLGPSGINYSFTGTLPTNSKTPKHNLMPVRNIALYIFFKGVLKPNNRDQECVIKCMRRNKSGGLLKE